MTIGKRRQDDSQLLRLNHRPTRYYLVRSRIDGNFIDQRIVAVFRSEKKAIAAAELDPKAIVTDCRDWTPEQLDNKSRSLWAEDDETQETVDSE